MRVLKPIVCLLCLIPLDVTNSCVRVAAFYSLYRVPASCDRARAVPSFGLPIDNERQVTRQSIKNYLYDSKNEPDDKKRAQVIHYTLANLATMMLSNCNGANPVYASEGVPDSSVGGTIKYGKDKDLMYPKAHGTTMQRVQSSLRFGITDDKLADRICSYNRHFAEYAGYFLDQSNLKDMLLSTERKQPIVFYDSVTGKPLFVAPIGRTAEEFLLESQIHGWPSFRDQEVVWDHVRVLQGSGETVSVDGTHLGHNLPDKKGNRYCINIVSIAGNPI